MTEKMRAYLDGIFAVVPATKEVQEAKEELFASMVERYNDCVLEGMDEQEAYDAVIESIGDVRELFSELGDNSAPTGNYTSDSYYDSYGQPKTPEGDAGNGARFGETVGETLNDIVQNVSEFASGLMSGLFSTGDPSAAYELVNTRNLSTEGVSALDVGYVSEGIALFKAEGDEIILKEYLNRNEPDLLARIEMRGNTVTIRNGRRTGVFGLRGYIALYIPESYAGSVSVSTVSGRLNSGEEWKLASLSARTVSGEIDFAGVEAEGMVRLTSTSGSVSLHKGAGAIEMHSISGSIRAGDIAGCGSFKTTSGAVRVDFTALTGNVEASTVSGGVRVMLPEDACFELDGRSVSGGIYTAWDSKLDFEKRHKAHGFIGRAPFHHIRLASTSGSIHVND